MIGRDNLAHPIYGRVERGSPILGCLLNSSIRIPFRGILCVNVFVLMWHLWFLYPHYLCCLYFGYEYVL